MMSFSNERVFHRTVLVVLETFILVLTKVIQ